MLDGRGRVLLPPALRVAASLRPGQKLAIGLGETELVVLPAPDLPADARSPTLDGKGRLTLPAPLRATLGLRKGGVLLAQPVPGGLVLVTPERLLGRLRAARLALQRRLDQD